MSSSRRVVLLDHLDRVVEVREQQRVDDETGPVAAVHRRACGSGRRPRRTVAWTSSGGQHRADHLDQFHGRRGVEEVHADDVLADAMVARAQATTGSEEVVVASTAPGLQTLSSVSKSCCLTVRSSATASDDQIHVREGVERTGRGDQRQCPLAVLSGDPALVDRTGQRCGDTGLGGVGLLRAAGGQHHPVATPWRTPRRYRMAIVPEPATPTDCDRAPADDALAAFAGVSGVPHHGSAAGCLVRVEAAAGLAAPSARRR